MSKMGICSRKQALSFVMDGKVTLNGRVIVDPGAMVGHTDRIVLDGHASSKKAFRYILFHKPAGYVTTRKDEKGRKTVYDILGDVGGWLFPVGRLDQESEGLLIFTNDTAFGDRLTDPRYSTERSYRVTIDGVLTEDDIGKIRKGVDIGRGEKTRPAHIAHIKISEDTLSEFDITLTEGKNREIRRIFESLGKPVRRLIRTTFGPFELGKIPAGQWKEISIPSNIQKK